MKKLGFLLMPLTLVVAMASPAYGDEAEVDCEDDPGALVGAVATAVSGTTLEIDGRCVGAIALDRDLTIEGSDDAVIDGAGFGPVVAIMSGATVVLENVTITGGSANGPRAIGGIDNHGNLTLLGVTVEGNTAEASGHHSAFPHNIAVGGVHNDELGSLTLSESAVRNNVAVAAADAESGFFSVAVGGVSNLGSATIDGTVVLANDATATGTESAVGVWWMYAVGGIQNDGVTASLTVEDTALRANSAMAASPVGHTIVVAVGGVSNSFGDMTLEDISVVANSAMKNHVGNGSACGGVNNDNNATPVLLENGVVRDNEARGWVAIGGVFTIFGDMRIEGTVITRNDARGELFAVGGVDSHRGSNVQLIDGTVTKNVAEALYVVGGVSATDVDATVSVDGTTIKKNVPSNCYEVPGCDG